MSDMLKELLKEGASAAQVELTDEQLDKFEKYYEYLIEKNKVDIYDIPIVEITRQYLEYVSKLAEENLDLASEFLVMAAT